MPFTGGGTEYCLCCDCRKCAQRDARIASLESRLKVAVEALEWYADDGVYSWAEFVFGDGTGSVDSEIMEDGGNKARAALAEIKEKERE